MKIPIKSNAEAQWQRKFDSNSFDIVNQDLNGFSVSKTKETPWPSNLTNSPNNTISTHINIKEQSEGNELTPAFSNAKKIKSTKSNIPGIYQINTKKSNVMKESGDEREVEVTSPSLVSKVYNLYKVNSKQQLLKSIPGWNSLRGKYKHLRIRFWKRRCFIREAKYTKWFMKYNTIQNDLKKIANEAQNNLMLKFPFACGSLSNPTKNQKRLKKVGFATQKRFTIVKNIRKTGLESSKTNLNQTYLESSKTNLNQTSFETSKPNLNQTSLETSKTNLDQTSLETINTNLNQTRNSKTRQPKKSWVNTLTSIIGLSDDLPKRSSPPPPPPPAPPAPAPTLKHTASSETEVVPKLNNILLSRKIFQTRMYSKFKKHVFHHSIFSKVIFQRFDRSFFVKQKRMLTQAEEIAIFSIMIATVSIGYAGVTYTVGLFY